MRVTPRFALLRRASLGAVALLAVGTMSACSLNVSKSESGDSAGSDDGASSSNGGSGSSGSNAKPESDVSFKSSVEDGANDVKIGSKLVLSAQDGTFRTVEVATKKGQALAGGLNDGRTQWKATGQFDQGRTYVVKAVGADSNGVSRTYSSTFKTGTLAKDEMTYPSVYPQPDAAVGVGMPITVKFDVPVTNRKRFEKHMTVTTSTGQTGSWNWLDDQTVHYRPEKYWDANSTVNVDLSLKNLAAGNGIYGQLDRKYSFTVGRSLISKVNIQTHQMQVIENGKQIKTIPITTGMAGFTTRSGTKVISEKDRTHDMNSETIGLDPNGPNGYNLKGVEYAMRLTNSGEFIHAAPWSVGSQGRANVSHGCTGMSTANAAWLFGKAMVGDPVEYTGSDVPMTLTNGFGDWNESWAEWQQGSALNG